MTEDIKARMVRTFSQGFKDKIDQAKVNLREKIDALLPIIEEVMIGHLSRGYFGFELLRDPFLWREECLSLVEEVGNQLTEKGYKLVMNSLYHTVMIVPPQGVGEQVEAEFSVGISGATQLIHYTLEDQNLKVNKDWKVDKETRIDTVEEKLEQVYYAPGMPGYINGLMDYVSLQE